MLTKKQNLLETIRGGHPDRYVNQFEYLSLVLDPVTAAGLGTVKKGGFFMNGWGVRMEFHQDAPCPFPNSAEEYLVVKDIAKWRESVKEPPVVLPEEAWRSCVEQLNKIDRNETFVAPIIVPGMIKMGIDIWQGAMTSNDIPKLVKQYGGQISFHGNIDNHAIDHPDWSREEVQNETIRRVREVGSKSYFIPGTVMGEPGSIFPEVYDIVSETICNINRQEQQA